MMLHEEFADHLLKSINRFSESMDVAIEETFRCIGSIDIARFAIAIEPAMRRSVFIKSILKLLSRTTMTFRCPTKSRKSRNLSAC